MNFEFDHQSCVIFSYDTNSLCIFSIQFTLSFGIVEVKMSTRKLTPAPAADSAQDIKLLFERPFEPLFTKRENGKVAFDVPQNYFTDRYQTIATELSSRLGEDVERTVALRPITLPNLDFANVIRIRGPFSLFNKKHQEAAGQLVKIFIEAPDSATFLSLSAYIKDRVNPYLFQVCRFTSVTLRVFSLAINRFR